MAEPIAVAWERARASASRRVANPERIIQHPRPPAVIRDTITVDGWLILGFLVDPSGSSHWRAEWHPETGRGRLVPAPEAPNAYTPAPGFPMTLEQARAFVVRYGGELRALGERVAAELAARYTEHETAPHIYSPEEHVQVCSGRSGDGDCVLAGHVSYEQSASRPFASALLWVNWETEEVAAEARDDEPVQVWRQVDFAQR